MLKILKNQDGFSGLIGILIAIVIIGIMSAMMLPTFTARMDYKQAQYVAGVTKTIENAENAYMAKNGSFADLVTLSQNGYLSPQFLQSLQPANNPGGPYPQPNWITLELAKHTVNLCIDNNGGCPDNPSGNNYFIGLYSVPSNYANYIEHELPGSGIGSQGGGLEYVAYAAPVPSAPPAGPSTYALSAGYALPITEHTQRWTNPGFYQWTVPSGVTVVGVTLAGGSGGYGGYSTILYNNNAYFGLYGNGGGGGGMSDQLLKVFPGETLDIYVGGNGGDGGNAGYNNGYYNGAGGYGGYGYIDGSNGGNGGNAGFYPGAICYGGGGGGGGGASAIVNQNTGQLIMIGYGGGGGGGGGGDGDDSPKNVSGCYGGYGGAGAGGAGGGAGAYSNSSNNPAYSGALGYAVDGSSIITYYYGLGYGYVMIQWN